MSWFQNLYVNLDTDLYTANGNNMERKIVKKRFIFNLCDQFQLNYV